MSQVPPLPPGSLPYASMVPVPNPRPTSVTVIAVLVIVFSAIGVLGPFGLIFTFVDFGQLRDPVQRALHDSGTVQVWMVVMTFFSFALSLANLIAAIKALKLAPWARRAMVQLAVAHLVLIAIGAIGNWLVVIPVVGEAARVHPEVKPAYFITLASGIVSPLLGAVLPALTIYFFNRPKVVEAFERPGAAY